MFSRSIIHFSKRVRPYQTNFMLQPIRRLGHQVLPLSIRLYVHIIFRQRKLRDRQWKWINFNTRLQMSFMTRINVVYRARSASRSYFKKNLGLISFSGIFLFVCLFVGFLEGVIRFSIEISNSISLRQNVQMLRYYYLLKTKQK